MRSLLVGNGLNCQFDKDSYTAKQIVLRILKNCNREDFPEQIVGDEPSILKEYLGILFQRGRDILAEKTKAIITCSAEKKSFEEFMRKYSSNVYHLKMTDICFEDYYLIHDLFCHSEGIVNPTQYEIREYMRFAYLYAIYNNGELDKLFMKYPKSFVDYLSSFDTIFTTNYDTNIESATGKSVIHLHGQFDKLSDVYDKNSLRNHLEDAPLKRNPIDLKLKYLYCNAITTHCGAYKESMVRQNTIANQGIDRMISSYDSDESIKKEIDSWRLSDNQVLKNLANAIVVKKEHPDLCFNDDYHFDRFEKISGELEMLGFSPGNDLHILKVINESKIDKCIYYYHSEKTCEKIKELLPNLVKNNRLFFHTSEELWSV